MTSRALSIAAVLLSVVCGASQAQRIERSGGEAYLVLPPAAQRALLAYDSLFAPRRLSDYPAPYTRECDDGADCPEFLSRHRDRQTLFAVIGDFNGDRVPDVVVDGDNGTTGARLAILSRGHTYRVEKIAVIEVVPPDVRRFRTRPRGDTDADVGVSEGLFYVPPGTYRSTFEDAPLLLRRDAFEVVHFEKATTLMYYRNGRWLTFVTSD